MRFCQWYASVCSYKHLDFAIRHLHLKFFEKGEERVSYFVKLEIVDLTDFFLSNVRCHQRVPKDDSSIFVNTHFDYIWFYGNRCNYKANLLMEKLTDSVDWIFQSTLIVRFKNWLTTLSSTLNSWWNRDNPPTLNSWWN